MKANTRYALSLAATVFNTKWLSLITPTETPSRRYVRKLRIQHMKSTNGYGGYMKKTSKIDDPNFKYINAAQSAEAGYLQNRMEYYKEMVKNESNGTIYLTEEISSDGQTGGRTVLGVKINRLQRPKLTAVGG
jgi:hypothetical protein